MAIYIYICTHICVCTYIYIHMYVYYIHKSSTRSSGGTVEEHSSTCLLLGCGCPKSLASEAWCLKDTWHGLGPLQQWRAQDPPRHGTRFSSNPPIWVVEFAYGIVIYVSVYIYIHNCTHIIHILYIYYTYIIRITENCLKQCTYYVHVTYITVHYIALHCNTFHYM